MITIVVVVAALLAGWLVMRALESGAQEAEQLEQQAHGNLIILGILVSAVIVGISLIGIAL